MLVYLALIESDEDKDKFQQLYTQYKRLMLKVAYRFFKSPDDAEDVVHDACIAIIENLDKVTDVNSKQTRNYIVIITKHIAINRYNRMHRFTLTEYDDAIHEDEIPAPGDGGLADALAALPVEYREVIMLKYYNGYSAAEIARMLDTTSGAVKTRLWRARKALEEAMGEEAVKE